MSVQLAMVCLLIGMLGVASPAAGQGSIDPGPEVALEPVADGLTHPVLLREAPDGTGRLFVVDQAGTIRLIAADGTLAETPFLDVRSSMVELRSGFDERGLLGLAFHPGFAANGRFFVYYSAPLQDDAPDGFDHTSRIAEFTVDAEDPDRADPASERLLLTIDEPQSNHNAGAIAFGPDGHLYVAVGDGGGRDDVGTGHADDWYAGNAGGNAQNVTANLLGKILRLDVDGGAPYAIPPDNPFTGTEGLDEIYAYGLRNPYRLSFDRAGDGALYVADVGQNRWEEVNVVERGGNYGWNVREATHCFDVDDPNTDAPACPEAVEAPGEPHDGDPLVAPVIEYLNSNQDGGIGRAVVGGFVYRGQAVPALDGRYVFGDWSADGSANGRLFAALPQAADGLWGFEELQLPDDEDGRLGAYLLGFGQDADGEVYVLTSANTGPTGTTGAVYRLAAPAGGTLVADRPELPETVVLKQNFPNPFNPSTTIHFDLPAAADVALHVVDVLGRDVATLADGPLPAGAHTATWDGRRSNGAAAAGGVYFYRLVVDGVSQTRAMTLLK